MCFTYYYEISFRNKSGIKEIISFLFEFKIVSTVNMLPVATVIYRSLVNMYDSMQDKCEYMGGRGEIYNGKYTHTIIFRN